MESVITSTTNVHQSSTYSRPSGWARRLLLAAAVTAAAVVVVTVTANAASGHRTDDHTLAVTAVEGPPASLTVLSAMNCCRP